MEIKANLKYLRMSPRKVRLVADALRGKNTAEASLFLNNLPKGAARPLSKLLKSAVTNAKHNFNLEQEKLFIKSIRVDRGPTLKRFMPRARGMASAIRKRMSHITLVLEENLKSKMQKSN